MNRMDDVVKVCGTAVGGFLVYRIVLFLRFRTEMNKRFPGPPASLLMGNLGDLTSNGGFSEQFFEFLHAVGGGNVSITRLSCAIHSNVETVCSILAWT